MQFSDSNHLSNDIVNVSFSVMTIFDVVIYLPTVYFIMKIGIYCILYVMLNLFQQLLLLFNLFSINILSIASV